MKKEELEKLQKFLWEEIFHYEGIKPLSNGFQIIEPCEFYDEFIKKYKKLAKNIRMKDCTVENWKDGSLISYCANGFLNCENTSILILMMDQALKKFDPDKQLGKVYLEYSSVEQDRKWEPIIMTD